MLRPARGDAPAPRRQLHPAPRSPQRNRDDRPASAPAGKPLHEVEPPFRDALTSSKLSGGRLLLTNLKLQEPLVSDRLEPDRVLRRLPVVIRSADLHLWEAAALNANRQIGALVGVALMGSVLHMVPEWRWRLPLAFGLITLSYAGAWLLVYRYVRVGRPSGVGGAPVHNVEM